MKLCRHDGFSHDASIDCPRRESMHPGDLLGEFPRLRIVTACDRSRRAYVTEPFDLDVPVIDTTADGGGRSVLRGAPAADGWVEVDAL